MVTEADRRRDAGDAAGAAIAYARALREAPWRADLVVQQGNMCKDCGQLHEAETLYARALADDPENADVHLQLGHVMKLMGRRGRALACYRRALALEPGLAAAQVELVQAGIATEQERAIAAQLRGHGIEHMLGLGAELAAMRDRLDEIGRDLPALATWTAIPAARYDLFRRLFDVPAAPPNVPTLRFRVVAAADTASVERLHALLDALHGQSVEAWEAVIHGSEPTRRRAVERRAAVDARLRWQERLPGESETAAENRAGSGADGWVLLLAPDAIPHRRALEWFGLAAALPATAIVCCDAEITPDDGTTPTRLLARWGFDPDLLDQRNIWGQTLAIESKRWNVAQVAISTTASLSERRTLLLRSAGPVVRHVPLPLVELTAEDWDAPGILNDVGEQTGEASRTSDRITVVIPTRNNADDCARMVNSLFEQAHLPDRLHCLVIDNGTDRPRDLAALARLRERDGVLVSECLEPFNWSALNNGAAKTIADGLLVFANDDMTMLAANWDRALRELLSRPDVGAVGAKLLYPDGTIQHGGILFGWQGSVIHDGLHETADSPAQMGRWQHRRRVGAVTGAFMGIRRDLFREIGGFDALALPIGYSDIDLCIRLGEHGYTVLWEPAIVLEHRESATRGLDHLEHEKRARDDAERRTMIARWGRTRFDGDRTMNPVWHDATLPFRLLRPVDAARASAYLNRDGSRSSIVAIRLG